MRMNKETRKKKIEKKRNKKFLKILNRYKKSEDDILSTITKTIDASQNMK